jgi:hypothetical protein
MLSYRVTEQLGSTVGSVAGRAKRTQYSQETECSLSAPFGNRRPTFFVVRETDSVICVEPGRR